MRTACGGTDPVVHLLAQNEHPHKDHVHICEDRHRNRHKANMSIVNHEHLFLPKHNSSLQLLCFQDGVKCESTLNSVALLFLIMLKVKVLKLQPEWRN